MIWNIERPDQIIVVEAKREKNKGPIRALSIHDFILKKKVDRDIVPSTELVPGWSFLHRICLLLHPNETFLNMKTREFVRNPLSILRNLVLISFIAKNERSIVVVETR